LTIDLPKFHLRRNKNIAKIAIAYCSNELLSLQTDKGDRMQKEQIITAAVIFFGLSAMVILGSYIATVINPPDQKIEKKIQINR